MQYLPEKLYLAEQAHEMDQLAIERFNILGIDLMRKAGLKVFELIQQFYPEKDITIFCGAGNNAGDGYVVAKLALQTNIKVNTVYVSSPDNLTNDASVAYKDFIHSGGVCTAFNPHIELKNCVIVDALLGIGLNRNVSGEFAKAISLINNSNLPVIAIDIPSGLNADTGAIMAHVINAKYTICFIALKQGMFTGYAADYCGKIFFSALELPDSINEKFDHSSKRILNKTLSIRNRCAHKGDNGHVLLVGGNVGYSGAIKLAAEAALRAGSGLVTVVTHPNHASIINNDRPELMCHGIKDPTELDHLLNKATVVVIGPGLGKGEWSRGLFQRVIKVNLPMIVDADALNLLADQFAYNDNWILTPHPGEAARLLECTTSEIAHNRFSIVKQIQKKYGGIAVLKGSGTLVYDGHETAVCTSGNPGMATGGMGDVLAGIIGGLVAQENNRFLATSLAVNLHGRAADLSAKDLGEIGMLASDLMPYIRKLVNSSVVEN